MAKKSMINRERKRTLTVAKYAVKRAALKAIIANPSSSAEERWEAQVALQKQPRDASRSRLRVSVTAAVLQVAHMVYIANSA